MSGLSLESRLGVLATLWRMAWRRKAWALIPALLFLALLVLFMAASEMPALIPFFYAVF